MPGLINIVVYVWRSKIYYGLDLCFVVFDTLHTHSSIIFCYVLLVGVVGLVFKSALRFFSPSPHKVSIYFSGWAVSCHCRYCCQLLDYSLQRGRCKFLPSLSSSPSLPPSFQSGWWQGDGSASARCSLVRRRTGVICPVPTTPSCLVKSNRGLQKDGLGGDSGVPNHWKTPKSTKRFFFEEASEKRLGDDFVLLSAHGITSGPVTIEFAPFLLRRCQVMKFQNDFIGLL